MADSIKNPEKQQGMIAIVFELALRCVLVFLVLEGASGVFLIGRKVYKFTEKQPQESGRFDFDAQLGWVSKPGVEVLDAFGEGKHIRINGQGFRRYPTRSSGTAPHLSGAVKPISMAVEQASLAPGRRVGDLLLRSTVGIWYSELLSGSHGAQNPFPQSPIF